MANIMIRCPHTGIDVSTGIDMDWTAFNRLRDVRSELVCPACGGIHGWIRSEAWLVHTVRPRSAADPDEDHRTRPRGGPARLRAV